MQIIIFLIIVVILNLALSKKVKSYSNIIYFSAGISISASICFQILGYVIMGYLDPFVLIAITIQIIIAFIIGFVVNSIVFKLKQKKEDPGLSS